MRRLGLLLATAGWASWTAACAQVLTHDQAHPFKSAAVRCPQGLALGDGCAGSNPTAWFTFTSYFGSPFYTWARQRGSGGVPQTWTGGAHSWAWNTTGDQFPVGYDSTLTLKDPHTATLPTGCTYTVGGGDGGSDKILCTSSVSPTFNGFNFKHSASTGHAVEVLVGCSSGTITLTNSLLGFDNLLNVSGAYLFKVAVASPCSLLVTDNVIDGGYGTVTPPWNAVADAIQDDGECGSGTAIPTVGYQPSLAAGCRSATFKRNVFLNMPGNPVAGFCDNTDVDIENNVIAGVNMAFVTHGAIMDCTAHAGFSVHSYTAKYNVAVYPTTAPHGGGTTFFSQNANAGNGSYYGSVDIEFNILVANLNAAGQTVGSATEQILWSSGVPVSYTVANNYVDPSGALSCFKNTGGTGSGWFGFADDGLGGGVYDATPGNILTITTAGAGAVYPGTTFGGIGLTDAHVKSYDTAGSTGTGGAGRYVLDGSAQAAQFTSGSVNVWRSKDVPIAQLGATLSISSNTNLLDGSTITTGGTQWDSGSCNGHATS